MRLFVAINRDGLFAQVSESKSNAARTVIMNWVEDIDQASALPDFKSGGVSWDNLIHGDLGRVMTLIEVDRKVSNRVVKTDWNGEDEA